jgi:sugar/nucleoside kinase (ribokinase family)
VLGGKGANQAVSVAQLGERVGLVGVVGDDDAGDKVLGQAQRDGIDVTTVMRRPGTSTGLIVEALEANGDWRYLQHLPDPVLLTEDDIAAAGDALASASACSCSCSSHPPQRWPPPGTDAPAAHWSSATARRPTTHTAPRCWP